jgi:acetyl-CoA synthetase
MPDQPVFSYGGEIVWQPTKETIERSHLHAFMKQHSIMSFQELMTRSTTDVAWFTDAILKYLDIQFQKPYTEVLNTSSGMPFAKWCVDGELNIAYNCLDKWMANEESRTRKALVYESEEGETASLTYEELYRQVNRCINALKHLGIGKGDAVALYMPMIPEIVIACLAIAKMGAVILPLFSGFGVNAILQRMNDVGAKCLFTADGVPRRGKPGLMKPTADEAVKGVPTLQHIIVVNRIDADIDMKAGRDIWWHDLVPQQSPEAECTTTSAEDILMVIHTSGTTGKPKGAVHTHCGFPVKSAQDMAFGTDIHQGDTIYWMSDMGWMMGPWLVFGTTLLGATCFIFDGAPDFPEPDRLWAMTARHNINVLGISPTLIRALITHGDDYVKKHDLSSIRFFASTGEPWKPDPWLWLFNVVGEGKRPIINYSGGTEISGGIVMGNPILPVKPTAFSAPCPGIAADVVDETGQSIRNAVGELVIKAPWIGMTRGFWKDNDRYLEAYWNRFDDTWVHGDWAAVDNDNMWYILGRSDDTIKVAGKRVGPAEVEAILVNHPNVSECAAIGVPHKIKGSEIVCFCILVKCMAPSESLKNELIAKVATEMGKPLAPKDIKFVSDIPKTRNGKIMRRIIRCAFLADPCGDISSLINPEALDDIKKSK